ncbi:MAG: TIR domain-containing protein, partial [Planctomycetota bacterium]|nr:TIR domain-containing protein [Planctomycetota bacterium]
MSDISKGQAASIFVSYRIKDTLQAADRLAVELRRVFGQDQVFFDRRTIEPGEIWPDRIEDEVKRAAVVIVLIGKQWLTVQDEHGYGRRRIDNHTDWVRREVEEALTIEGRVVPVLVDDASPVPAAALVDLPHMAKLASRQPAKLRTVDWDSDFNALVNLLKSKVLIVLKDKLISSYQLAIQRQWQEQWSGNGDVTSDKPPFIDTQGLRLLLDTNRPEQYLHPAYFRVGRGTRASMAEQDLGDWVEVDRNVLAANELTVANELSVPNESRVDLSRLVITTDAGVGKTTTMQWLEAELNRPGAATVAFHLTFSHVPAHVDELLCELARRLLQKQQRDDGSVNWLTQDDAVRIIESLRDEGRLVLILDALDQEPADGSAAILVGELLQDSSWKRCRIVISGRPHALQRHWQALFASHLGWGWRFVQVDEFTPDQQRQFLGVDQRGKNRLELIPQEAREILSTPRVLSYLRKLPDAELRKIRTAGDVYWHSVQHLLVAGMQGSEAARRIG